MLTVYIVISILWGLLIFLSTFQEYKWYSSLIFSIFGILFWPLFILIAVIIEIVRLCKSKKIDIETEVSDNVKRENVLEYIRENITKNE